MSLQPEISLAAREWFLAWLQDYLAGLEPEGTLEPKTSTTQAARIYGQFGASGLTGRQSNLTARPGQLHTTVILGGQRVAVGDTKKQYTRPLELPLNSPVVALPLPYQPIVSCAVAELPAPPLIIGETETTLPAWFASPRFGEVGDDGNPVYEAVYPLTEDALKALALVTEQIADDPERDSFTVPWADVHLLGQPYPQARPYNAGYSYEPYIADLQQRIWDAFVPQNFPSGGGFVYTTYPTPWENMSFQGAAGTYVKARELPADTELPISLMIEPPHYGLFIGELGDSTEDGSPFEFMEMGQALETRDLGDLTFSSKVALDNYPIMEFHRLFQFPRGSALPLERTVYTLETDGQEDVIEREWTWTPQAGDVPEKAYFSPLWGYDEISLNAPYRQEEATTVAMVTPVGDLFGSVNANRYEGCYVRFRPYFSDEEAPSPNDYSYEAFIVSISEDVRQEEIPDYGGGVGGGEAWISEVTFDRPVTLPARGTMVLSRMYLWSNYKRTFSPDLFQITFYERLYLRTVQGMMWSADVGEQYDVRYHPVLYHFLDARWLKVRIQNPDNPGAVVEEYPFLKDSTGALDLPRDAELFTDLGAGETCVTRDGDVVFWDAGSAGASIARTTLPKDYSFPTGGTLADRAVIADLPVPATQEEQETFVKDDGLSGNRVRLSLDAETQRYVYAIQGGAALKADVEHPDVFLPPEELGETFLEQLAIVNPWIQGFDGGFPTPHGLLRNPLLPEDEEQPSQLHGLTWTSPDYVCDCFYADIGNPITGELETHLFAVVIAREDDAYSVKVSVDDVPAGEWSLLDFFPGTDGSLSFLSGEVWDGKLETSYHYGGTGWPYRDVGYLPPFRARLKNPLVDKVGKMFMSEAADCPVVLFLESYPDHDNDI